MVVDWALASQVATTVGSFLTIVGLIVVIVQLSGERRQTRLASLDAMYAQFDTHEARLNRELIYKAEPHRLSFDYLHSEAGAGDRRVVENTLAMFERMAYPVVKGYLPSEDAFELYGGVLLAATYKLWPYIEAQRKVRQVGAVGNKLLYRRFLEALVKEWVPKYALAVGQPKPTASSTGEMLRGVVERKAPAA